MDSPPVIALVQEAYLRCCRQQGGFATSEQPPLPRSRWEGVGADGEIRTRRARSKAPAIRCMRREDGGIQRRRPPNPWAKHEDTEEGSARLQVEGQLKCSDRQQVRRGVTQVLAERHRWMSVRRDEANFISVPAGVLSFSPAWDLVMAAHRL